LDAALGDIGYLRQRFRAEALDYAGNIGSVSRGDYILVKNMDRVVALRHMDAGEISPDTAHSVKTYTLKVLEPVLLAKRPVDHRCGFGKAAMRHVDQAERPERQCSAGSRLAARYGHQFEAAATQIADKAIRLRDTGEHALRGEASFVDTG